MENSSPLWRRTVGALRVRKYTYELVFDLTVEITGKTRAEHSANKHKYGRDGGCKSYDVF